MSQTFACTRGSSRPIYCYLCGHPLGWGRRDSVPQVCQDDASCKERRRQLATYWGGQTPLRGDQQP